MKMGLSSCLSFVGLFFLVLFSMFKVSWCTTLIRCPEIEKQSLLSFKRDLQDPYNVLSSWKAEVNCCEWEWVSCNNLTGNVNGLNLGSRSLTGEISNSISNLTSLRTLDLSLNELYGNIFNSISNLTSLHTLNLYANRFYGNIFNSISNLTSLRTLNLYGNRFYGKISNSISSLTSLKFLDLSGNQLYGNIPRGISNLCELHHLDLGGNNLQGDISNLFGNISSCSLRELEHLDLSDNQLSGNLPETMGQLSNLELLVIKNNKFEGVVMETHFVRLSKLELLKASGNNLTLKVDPNWIPPFKIANLGLGSWNMGSRFPSWLDTQKMSIRFLDLSNAGLNDKVPSWICSIGYLNLSHNQLHGKIPMISAPMISAPNLLKYRNVDLGSNRFSGQLPRLSPNMSSMLDLYLSNNLLSGDLSDFLCNNTSVSRLVIILHLGGNHLSGKLPEDCLINWSSVNMLNLSNNNLSGKIPNSIGLLLNLVSLNLNGNNFSGDIPLSMGNCTHLLKIDLADNNLSGNRIPTSSSNLMILILRSNRLSGEITSAICMLNSLTILDLSNNMFSGTIPRCVNNFNAMTTRIDLHYGIGFPESASISTKGREFTYDIILSLVRSVDISRNNLSGNIPDEITSLVELRSLNLSGNRLEGRIPFAIGNMTQLESLDLSNNSLFGELPNSLKAMSSLNYLNVSYNQLTGRIPETTQLCSFDRSSFVGNLHLWGPPLTTSCGNKDVKSPPGTLHPNDKDVEKLKIEWLYVFMSLGCAVGLSASLTTLYLKRSWREAYFELIEDTWDTAYVYFHIK